MSKESVKDRILWAIDFVENALAKSRFNVSRRDRSTWRIQLPYCVREASDTDPSHSLLVVLNRLYKPLGTDEVDPVTGKWLYLDYAHSDYSPLHFDFSPRALTRISLYSDEGHYWLFNDATTPWKNRYGAEAYVDRLRLFADLLSPPSPRAVGRRWTTDKDAIA